MNRELAKASVLKTGPGTSIQDLGRQGMANFGVPISGAMDQRALLWINHLLQNDENAAVLEISQPGFSIRFDTPTSIALAGALVDVKLNGVQIQNPAIIPIHLHGVLEIGAFKSGARLYLGIKHGFQSSVILGSRSFYQGLTSLSQLSKEDKIPYFVDSNPIHQHNAKAKWSSDWYRTETILAYPGPDFSLLDTESREKLIGEPYRISTFSNRMGLQLSELLENELPELPTNPVFPGMVQLTSGGKLVILLKDAQVTGGYPRVLYLDEKSQGIVAQKKPGEQLRFSLISSKAAKNDRDSIR
ncbi:biotin-dependent carboxyltransferase family protein [Algoriphagus jejuensis]|uniref:Biotin-dependent carboxyltransferase family protein n=1 Tax=Algoriphagus jejuensis TaxID=419934 RepID=A0ABP3YI65_9BACT